MRAPRIRRSPRQALVGPQNRRVRGDNPLKTNAWECWAATQRVARSVMGGLIRCGAERAEGGRRSRYWLPSGDLITQARDQRENRAMLGPIRLLGDRMAGRLEFVIARKCVAGVDGVLRAWTVCCAR